MCVTCPPDLHSPPQPSSPQQPPRNRLPIIIYSTAFGDNKAMVKDHDFLHQAIYGVSVDADDKKKPFFWNLPRVRTDQQVIESIL